MNEQEIDQQQTAKRKKIAWIVIACITFLLALALVLWFIDNRRFKRTNDSYVEGNQLVITPLQDGFITSVHTQDTYLVKKNQLLVTLDETNYLIAIREAKENYANAIRDVCTIFHQAAAYAADIEVKKAEFIKAEEFYNHRLDVVEEGAVSLEDFQSWQAALDATYSAYEESKSLYKKENSLIQGKSIRSNPIVVLAAEKLSQAWVNLYRCKIYAPVEGLVAQRTAQVGMWVSSGDQIMSIIPLDQVWVNANFKETQMRHIKIGQTAWLHADMYGTGITYQGIIVGLPGGAGNAFSILPPQNLSGNWIKIVQRLPVRVAIKPEDLVAHPLRVGMTMRTHIDLKSQNEGYIPTQSNLAPIYKTDIYTEETCGVGKLVDKIFKDNIDPTLLDYADVPYYPDTYLE